ncbi:MAG: hypothetical protein QM757_06215 [Paludibaculum sp.]
MVEQLAAYEGVLQCLGLHPERVDHNGLTRSYKFGGEYRPIKFPFFQVPYPHGEMNFNQNETAYPSATGTQGVVPEYSDR